MVADLGTIDLSAIRPLMLVPAVAAYVAVLALRGAQLRLLAPTTGAGHGRWVALAARHQLVFILSPSGAGNLAFPLLAGRMVGLGLGPAAALIAGARLRDICAVGLGCAGLAGTVHLPVLAEVGAVLCVAALYFSDIAVALARQLLRRFRKAAPPQPAAEPNRLSAALLTLLLWLTASGGITAGFAAAGHPLGPFEAWVMLAGLNVAGALALSLAGLGVAEAGVALGLPGLPRAEPYRVPVAATVSGSDAFGPVSRAFSTRTRAMCGCLAGRCDALTSWARKSSSICTPKSTGKALSMTVPAVAGTPVRALSIHWVTP